jgi:membrane-anchored glycerophosphoryl diester phosphodiesterase (GDPDase)
MALNSRPLTLGEILDRTIQIYRRNFLLFAGIAVIPAGIYVVGFGGFSIFFSAKTPAMAASGAGSMQAALAIFLALGIFLVVGVPLLLGSFAVGMNALSFATLQINHGYPATVRSSYAYAFRFFWRSVGILFFQILFAVVIPGFVFSILFSIVVGITVAAAAAAGSKGTAALMGLMMVGLLLAFAAVCVWIWVRLALAFPASIAEGRRVWDAIKRGNELSKGTRGRIAVMYLLMFVLALIANYALVIPIDLAMGLRPDRLFTPGGKIAIPVFIQVANLVVAFLVRIVAMPISLIALVLFYQDQRTRNEGYDIEQLMTQAGWAQMPPQQFAQPQFPPQPFPPPQFAEAQMPPPQFPPAAMAPISPVPVEAESSLHITPEASYEASTEVATEQVPSTPNVVEPVAEEHPPSHAEHPSAEDANA